MSPNIPIKKGTNSPKGHGPRELHLRQLLRLRKVRYSASLGLQLLHLPQVGPELRRGEIWNRYKPLVFVVVSFPEARGPKRGGFFLAPTRGEDAPTNGNESWNDDGQNWSHRVYQDCGLGLDQSRYSSFLIGCSHHPSWLRWKISYLSEGSNRYTMSQNSMKGQLTVEKLDFCGNIPPVSGEGLPTAVSDNSCRCSLKPIHSPTNYPYFWCLIFYPILSMSKSQFYR